MWSLPALLIFSESTAVVIWWLPRDQGEVGGREQGEKWEPSQEWKLARRSETGSDGWLSV